MVKNSDKFLSGFYSPDASHVQDDAVLTVHRAAVQQLLLVLAGDFSVKSLS